MHSRFGDAQNQLLILIPSAVVAPKWRYALGDDSWLNHAIKAGEKYHDELPYPELFSTQLLEWQSYW